MNSSSTVRKSLDLLIQEIDTARASVDWESWEKLPDLVLQAASVFTVGNGRSGLALRMAAMRLMHLGRTVHVVGDVTTPAIVDGDLLLAVSGSGSTAGVVHAAATAAEQRATVVAITANPSSQLAEAASHVLLIPAPEKTDRGGKLSAQYAGTLFEQLAVVLLDAVFHSLWQRDGRPAEELYQRHANLG